MNNPASNTRDCFREFVGQRVIGLLFDALPDDRQLSPGSKTLIFEDRRGLTISGNGTYWIESVETVARAVERQKAKLTTAQRELNEVLATAGAMERQP